MSSVGKTRKSTSQGAASKTKAAQNPGPQGVPPSLDRNDGVKRDEAQFRGKLSAEQTAAQQTVDGWSTDWKKHLKMPPAPEMSGLQGEAVDAVSTAQKNFTVKNGQVMRAQHARAVYSTTDGTLKVPDTVPQAIAKGPFVPGTELRALVRISNVSGTVQKDGDPDLRGFALRLTDDKGRVQDLMMNTSEEFMTKGAKGAIVGVRVRGQGALQLAKGVIDGHLSPGEALHLAKAGKKVLSNNTSVAAHTYWSRTPFQLGDHAVKLRLVPVDPHSNQPLVHGDEELSDDMRMRLQSQPVKYLLQVQGYVNETETPMNDATKTWSSAFVTVGELELPTLPKDNAQATSKLKAAESEIDSLAFSIANRWSKDDGSLKGLGDINAIREKAYVASAEGRGITGAQGLRCPMGYA